MRIVPSSSPSSGATLPPMCEELMSAVSLTDRLSIGEASLKSSGMRHVSPSPGSPLLSSSPSDDFPSSGITRLSSASFAELSSPRSGDTSSTHPSEKSGMEKSGMISLGPDISRSVPRPLSKPSLADGICAGTAGSFSATVPASLPPLSAAETALLSDVLTAACSPLLRFSAGSAASFAADAFLRASALASMLLAARSTASEKSA